MEQWHWNLLYSTGLLGIFFYLITKHMRYNFGREFILNMFCTMQGRKYKWIREPNLARRVLSSSSSKGIGVEQLLSTEAFLPIVSLESVIDEQWIRMKDNFVILKSHLPSLDALSTIADDITKYYLEMEENRVIDCPTLVKLTVQIMQAWLFGVPKEMEVNPMIIAAIEEYRKEIAVKGKGDPRLKLYVTEWIQEEIRSHKNIYEIFEEKWFSDEYWSLLLQPFFISPAINITDIAITLTCKEFKEEFQLSGGSSHDFDMERILCAINYKHPFPIFERWFPHGLKYGEQFIIEPNTHCFVPIDEIGRNCCNRNATNSYWSAFGAGKRACGGRDIAMTLCTNIFRVLLTHQRSEEKFKPWIEHNYSGRDNDFKETLSQTFHQVMRLVQISWKLVRQRVELGKWSIKHTHNYRHPQRIFSNSFNHRH